MATPNPGGFYYAHPIYWSRWRLSRLQAWSRMISRACSRHKCAPGEAGFEVAQRAITTPGILLQYPTPRLPRTSISKIVLPKSSLTTVIPELKAACLVRPQSGIDGFFLVLMRRFLPAR